MNSLTLVFKTFQLKKDKAAKKAVPKLQKKDKVASKSVAHVNELLNVISANAHVKGLSAFLDFIRPSHVRACLVFPSLNQLFFQTTTASRKIAWIR